MVASSISPPRTSVGPAIAVVRGERPGIGVFDAAENLEELGETLSKIGYRTVGYSSYSTTPARETADGFCVALISDGMDNPLQLAAEMSRRHPVLFITSDVSIEARLAAARAGVDAILPRPLDLSELAEWLNDLVGPHRDTPLSILIVDDDEIVAESYALELENAGMRAFIKTDPAAALDDITTRCPDLVLMDMQMPSVNGIELARMIRQSRRHLSLPIVFLSAERDPARQLEARRLGGDDFICKPVDPIKLVSLVRMRAERAVRLRSIMERDSLTGLLNHGRFVDRLNQELERCRRRGAEVSLALIDLDRFKNINDTYGHLMGDQVLRTLALSLSSGLRRIDIIGRYGGEEFGVLLLDTPPQATFKVVEKIRARFSEITFDAINDSFSATFSAGVAGSRAHPTPEQLIGAADEQMYLAKAAGRNRISHRPGCEK
jgi:diguanylate cyclase (GGDEF)-like protein